MILFNATEPIISVLDISHILLHIGMLPLERSDTIHLTLSDVGAISWNAGPLWDFHRLPQIDIWQKNRHLRENND